MSEERSVEVKEDISEIASFDLTKKKKKKKKKVQPEDKADESVDNLADQTENFTINDGAESSSFGLKKKKRPVREWNLISSMMKMSVQNRILMVRKEGKRLPCLEILGKELIEIIDTKSF